MDGSHDGRHTRWRHRIDDEIYRVRMVWLGPPEVLTFPWKVRYASYLMGALILGAILLAEHAAGILHGWPVFETAIAIGATHLAMRTVTFERPLGAAARIFVAACVTEVARWRRTRSRPQHIRLWASAVITREGDTQQ